MHSTNSLNSEQVAPEKLEPLVEHGEHPLKGKDLLKQNGNDKSPAKGNEGKDTVPKTTKKELDDKLKVPKETATSHLKGSRLSLCVSTMNHPHPLSLLLQFS